MAPAVTTQTLSGLVPAVVVGAMRARHHARIAERRTNIAGGAARASVASTAPLSSTMLRCDTAFTVRAPAFP